MWEGNQELGKKAGVGGGSKDGKSVAERERQDLVTDWMWLKK